MEITFLGACREVTGSNFLIQTKKSKMLLECGLFQGNKFAEERNYSPFKFDPRTIDCVIICHAHLDHTGRLPKLVKEGFRGQVYSTSPTKELTRLVLEDSQKLMREEAERENHLPLYTKAHIDQLMELFITIDYGQSIKASYDAYLTLENAGHILGSATATIESDGQKLVYTSDLGNNPSLLLNPPKQISSAQFLICEGTYGGRIHEDISKRNQKLSQVINATISQNGVLLIPSFAIERTQELLHDIEHFCTIQNCEKPKFFLDSPLASKVTAVFNKFPQYLSSKLKNVHKDYDFFGLERLRITSSVEESKLIRETPNPKVIIAGSGMFNGGRILFHARDYLPSPQNTLLFVGYQALGTLGRKILEGAKEIKIFGKKIAINAQVKAIGSYSAHADQPQLIDWIGKIRNLKTVFIVHGETTQVLPLARVIESKFSIKAEMPQLNESHAL